MKNINKIIFTVIIACSCIRSGYSEGAVTGFTLGTPGVVNMNIGFYGNIFGIQGSISMLHLAEAWLSGESDDTASDIKIQTGIFYALFQFNLDLAIYQSDQTIVALSAAGGIICFTDDGSPENDLTLFYAGPCVHLFLHGFYLEVGAAYGKDFSAKYEEDNTHIIPLVQIGYMKYF